VLKFLLKKYLQKENKLLNKYLLTILKENKINFLDIGASHGIPERWFFLEKGLKKFLVEPHSETSKDLKDKDNIVIEKLLGKNVGENLSFYETKKRRCSSFLKPNVSHLNKFPDPERFAIERIVNFSTSTLDKEFENLKEKPDFIKIDTEGSELDILQGSTKSLDNILGIEIEVSFFQLREGQPLISDTLKVFSKTNLEFVDFLSMIRWEKDSHRFTGQPQISDLLFLQKPENILKNYLENKITEDILRKYICILSIYQRIDYLKFLCKNEKIQKNIPEIKIINDLIEKKINRVNLISRISYVLINKIQNVI
tara:strand:+ start:345 stop:1280 length:936 start_codon:yes stop_codon:yes gene_type:complete